MNHIRPRIWNHPASGSNNKTKVLACTKAAKPERLKLIVDSHNSDNWTGHVNPNVKWIPYAARAISSPAATHIIRFEVPPIFVSGIGCLSSKKGSTNAAI